MQPGDDTPPRKSPVRDLFQANQIQRYVRTEISGKTGGDVPGEVFVHEMKRLKLRLGKFVEISKVKLPGFSGRRLRVAGFCEDLVGFILR